MYSYVRCYYLFGVLTSLAYIEIYMILEKHKKGVERVLLQITCNVLQVLIEI